MTAIPTLGRGERYLSTMYIAWSMPLLECIWLGNFQWLMLRQDFITSGMRIQDPLAEQVTHLIFMYGVEDGVYYDLWRNNKRRASR